MGIALKVDADEALFAASRLDDRQHNQAVAASKGGKKFTVGGGGHVSLDRFPAFVLNSRDVLFTSPLGPRACGV